MACIILRNLDNLRHVLYQLEGRQQIQCIIRGDNSLFLHIQEEKYCAGNEIRQIIIIILSNLGNINVDDSAGVIVFWTVVDQEYLYHYRQLINNNDSFIDLKIERTSRYTEYLEMFPKNTSICTRNMEQRCLHLRRPPDLSVTSGIERFWESY